MDLKVVPSVLNEQSCERWKVVEENDLKVDEQEAN